VDWFGSGTGVVGLIGGVRVEGGGRGRKYGYREYVMKGEGIRGPVENRAAMPERRPRPIHSTNGTNFLVRAR
jgi:hypothetical protein